jgi:predicted transcriptional regulator
VSCLEKPDLYIVGRFLDILYRNGSPMKKTNIQMSLRLTYPRFKEYLVWMLEHQLVSEIQDEEDKSEKIALTPKGIDSYRRLVDWLSDTIGGVKF